MYELCDYLIGIYKTCDCTHSITIDPRIYERPNNDLNNGQVNHEQSGSHSAENNSPNNKIATHSAERNSSGYGDSANVDNEANDDDECLGNVTVEDSFEMENMDVDDN